MIEHTVKEHVIRYAERLGWRYRKVAYEGRNGAPDNWFFKGDGRLVIIEFKRPGKPARRQQELEIQRFQNEGFRAHVVDNIEGGCALFD